MCEQTACSKCNLRFYSHATCLYKRKNRSLYFSFGKMKLSVVGLVLVFGLTCVQCSSVDVDKRKESELVTISIPQSILKYIFSTRNLKRLIFYLEKYSYIRSIAFFKGLWMIYTFYKVFLSIQVLWMSWIWYCVTIVFCYQNCSDLSTLRKNCSSDREKLLKFKAVGGEFENILRSFEQFIQTVKGRNNFW